MARGFFSAFGFATGAVSATTGAGSTIDIAASATGTTVASTLYGASVGFCSGNLPNKNSLIALNIMFLLRNLFITKYPMQSYFVNLDFNFDFSLIAHNIKEIPTDQVVRTDHSEWWKVSIDQLLSIHPISLIEEHANKHQLTIIHAIFRKQFSKNFTRIHTDSFNLFGQGLVTVPVSLNLPLENTDNSTTRWYDFTNHPIFKNYNLNFTGTQTNIINANSDKQIEEILKYSVKEFKMQGAVLFNTAIPHNVDSRDLTSSRSIISIWFFDKQTGQLASMEKTKAVFQPFTID